EELLNPTIQFNFVPLWSKISTALSPVPGFDREVFKYQASNYDELLDCPVEIGCHETDGFKLAESTYEIATYGTMYPHSNDIKKDIKKITEFINNYIAEVPFKHYLYLIHFLPDQYGGLEHANSTV